MDFAAPFESADGVRRNSDGRGRNFRYSQAGDQVVADANARIPGSSLQPASKGDSRATDQNLETVPGPDGSEVSPERAGVARSLFPEHVRETAIHPNLERPGANPLQGASLVRADAPAFNGAPAASSQSAAPAWSPVLDRVSGEIAAHVRQNRHEALIQLEPPELGKLKISLLVQGDTVRAHLVSETDEARSMIQTHLPELREALQLHKLDLLHVSVDVSGWSGSAEEWNGRWPSDSARQERDDLPVSEEKTIDERGKPAEGGGVNVWA